MIGEFFLREGLNRLSGRRPTEVDPVMTIYLNVRALLISEQERTNARFGDEKYYHCMRVRLASNGSWSLSER
jgi:hypothetical protein